MKEAELRNLIRQKTELEVKIRENEKISEQLQKEILGNAEDTGTGRAGYREVFCRIVWIS